jgi:hypothetical protein
MGISGNGLIAGSNFCRSVTLVLVVIQHFFIVIIITDANGCISTCSKLLQWWIDTLPIVTTAEASLNQTSMQ